MDGKFPGVDGLIKFAVFSAFLVTIAALIGIGFGIYFLIRYFVNL